MQKEKEKLLFYYLLDGIVRGPLDLEDLKRNEIHTRSLVKKVGAKKWEKAALIPEIKEYFNFPTIHEAYAIRSRNDKERLRRLELFDSYKYFLVCMVVLSVLMCVFTLFIFVINYDLYPKRGRIAQAFYVLPGLALGIGNIVTIGLSIRKPWLGPAILSASIFLILNLVYGGFWNYLIDL